MEDILLSTALLLLIVPLSTRTGSHDFLKQNVYVSRFGHDTEDCGLTNKPCRTIAQGIQRVTWGGYIYLDGTGTKKQPFDCKNIPAHARLYVHKSLVLTSFQSTPHVSCKNGFYFQGCNFLAHEELHITLSGIVFHKTPLTFEDCSYVEVINCILQDATTAIAVQVKTSLSVNIAIRGCLFQSNSLCLALLLFGQVSFTNVSISCDLAINNTKFLNNGFYGPASARGIIRVASVTKMSRLVYMRVTCNEITSLANRGFFMHLNLSTAITSETYNTVDWRQNAKKGSNVGSLYFSKARSADIRFVRLRCWNNSKVNCIDVTGTAGGFVHVNIDESSFHYNQPMVETIKVTAVEPQAGTISISNTTMIGNRNQGILMTPNFKITLTNVTLSSSMTGIVLKHNWVDGKYFHVNICIDRCTFRGNLHDFVAVLNNTIDVMFLVKNTLFDGRHVMKTQDQSTFGIRFIIPPLVKTAAGRAHIELDNVTFERRPENTFVLFYNGTNTVQIRRCTFRNSVCLEPLQWILTKFRDLPSYITCPGSLSLLFNLDVPVNRGCVRRGVRNNTHPSWHYTNHAVFEDTVFQNNAGRMAGAVQLTNGNVTFRRCSFTDNFAIKESGQVYIGYGSAKVTFVDCTFKRTIRDVTINKNTFPVGTFLYSESGGPVVIQNTSFLLTMGARASSEPTVVIWFGGYFDMDSSSTIQCAIGSLLKLKNFTHFFYQGEAKDFCRVNSTCVSYSCKMCPSGMYSLQNGSSNGLTIRGGFQCLGCPFGAVCKENTNIVAKPNYWGYENKASSNISSLIFHYCPPDYCRTPTRSQPAVYNSCYGNRMGILCGMCVPGFTETLFSSNCRKAVECHLGYLLWVLMALYTLGLTIYLLKKPPLVRFLKDQTLWFRRHLNPANEESECGYLKITFYFYQVAGLLLGNSLQNLKLGSTVPFISTLVAAFNFQVLVVDREIGCPFAGLSVATKDLFLCVWVFVSMGHVFLIYCVHATVNVAMGKERPPLLHYAAVVIEILLLGYERLAETSLKLMHCVSIGSEKRLFFDGNVQCWQLWQAGLLAFNVIFVVPFIAVLYKGSGKLYYRRISWREFVGACFLPLPFLVYWLAKYICNRQRSQGGANHEDAGDILKVLHGPFRPPNNSDRGTLYWESVLIGRRFVLLSFHAFIPNPMLRAVCMAGACVVVTVHHLVKRPYRSGTANTLEALSLISLTCMAIIHVPISTLASSAISAAGPNKGILEVFHWIEVSPLFFAPAAICLLVIFAIFSQLGRFLLFLTRQICNSAGFYERRDEARPLLHPCYDDG